MCCSTKHDGAATLRVLGNQNGTMRSHVITALLMALAVAAGCGSSPMADDELVATYSGTPAVDLSGHWERDYSRGDDVNRVVDRAFRQLRRYSPDPALSNNPYGPNEPSLSRRDMADIIAIARLADNITRVDVLAIEQDAEEITVERKDDFSLYCTFQDGNAAGPATEYGAELCGWDGSQFVSRLVLPDGLRVTHRFTIADDRTRLRVSTTVSSRQANVPITLHRFYKKFDKPESDFNCIETLSMKRVCSTSEITP